MSVEIELTKGQTTTVCDCCFHLVCQQKWYASFDKKKGCFYVKGTNVENGKSIYLHRKITMAMAGVHVDHINGNTLDNRCVNLRFVTRNQNMWNSRPSKHNECGFKGVSFDKKTGKYRARLRHYVKFVHIGVFDNPKDAAIAYDNKAIELFGEYARINFNK